MHAKSLLFSYLFTLSPFEPFEPICTQVAQWSTTLRDIATMAQPATIPRLYWYLFTWVDGLYSLLVAYIHFFAYEGPTREHFPQLPDMPVEAFRPFFFPIGGGMLFVATIQLALLRHSSDIWTWKVVQFGHVMLDVSMLLSMVEILNHQPLVDWQDIATTGAFHGLVLVSVRTIVRLFFLVGVGLGPRRKRVKFS